jgi:hypothetical protein
MGRACIAALVLLASCGSGSDDLERHQQLWSSKKPAAYQYTFETRGFSRRLKLRITVQDGAVSSSVTLDPALPTASGQTIDELFGDIGTRLHDAHCAVQTSYEDSFGYPVAVYSDCGEEGDGWSLSDFSPA